MKEFLQKLFCNDLLKRIEELENDKHKMYDDIKMILLRPDDSETLGIIMEYDMSFAVESAMLLDFQAGGFTGIENSSGVKDAEHKN